MAKYTTNEFIVAYRDRFDDYNSVLNTSCKTWNNTAKNQLRRKINTLKDVWEDEKRKTRNFEVGFTNGSKAYFLYIPKNISVYELHTELRESFLEGIKGHDKLSFNVLNLNQSHQSILINALTSLVHLAEWTHPKYGKKAKKPKRPKKSYGFYSSVDSKEPSITGHAIAEGTNLVRTLATTPTNHMTSKHLVEESKKIGKKLKGVKVEFLNEKKLKEMGAGSFLSVIQGTKGSHGGIVHMSYRTRAKHPKNIAIVGKGVVFDTGGYDIKTEGYLVGMHRDMTGSAVSLALFKALVETKAKANIDLYMAIGENLISEEAFKPNDVVVAMDGTSIEVTNTDAEGRMLLIDTLIYANKLKPDLILDYATLTGSITDAIDNRYAGVFSNREDLAIKAVEAGRGSGERVWSFPMTDDFSNTLGSNVADISQCTNSNYAEHIYAACLLQHFAGKTPWIHVDLGCEISDNGLGLIETEVTGFGVRWGYEFIKNYIKE